ncbi:MAG: class II aldolase/adducin family protein, partial [Sulfurimonadaceae bacterium]|nr:class II aldolase/adducin family protein [Sulfurimonadaceae bacterium]
MENLFDTTKAETFGDSKLAMRVYTSRLLGASKDLVLHGGGNTSVKIGDTLYVKGSGWDLATIEEPGFSPVDLDVLIAMAERDELSDSQMVKEQRAALRDQSAPNPSIEAILHAIIPFDYVDHTHADAVVTISNTPDGKERIQEVYGDNMLIVDYVMPGFILAKHIYDLTRNTDWNTLEGIILLNHGIFTFDNDAKKSYDKMIEQVTKAEEYIAKHTRKPASTEAADLSDDYFDTLSKKVAELRGCDITMKHITTDGACELSQKENLQTILFNGELTPEHVIRIKPFPAIVGSDIDVSIHQFMTDYKSYFDKHADESHICLDLAPRYAIIPGYGAVTFGKDEKEASVIA